MKIISFVSLVTVLCSSIASAAESHPTSSQLQVYPKNLARQHLGSNLFVFYPSTQSYAATEAAAAWLDDDATTGWPVIAGKQHYLLVLTEPELLTNFSLSARPASGTLTLFAGDEPAAPGAPSWTAIAKDVSLDAVNGRKLHKPFSRFAKYVLVETDIAEPGPVFSLYLYGEKPAVSYTLRQREQPIDARAIFGPYVNDQTNFNTAGLYASGRVAYSNSPDGYLSWQKAIDDNPETGVSLAGSTSEAGAVIALGASRSVSRISVLADPGAKGQLDFYVVNAPATAEAPAARTAASVTGISPTGSMVFDGSTQRASIDLGAAQGTEIAVRWSPISASDTITLREVSAFSSLTMNEYEVGGSLSAVADFSGGNPDGSKDGKTFKEIIDPKKNPEPIAAGPGSPYLPGSLGFPPNLTGRRLPPVDPESN